MISSLVNFFLKPDPYVACALKNDDDFEQLINEVSTSQLSGRRLVCVQNEDKTYTLRSRDVKWYEYFTSLFWVKEEERTSRIENLFDRIIINNQDRIFDETLSRKALEIFKKGPCKEASLQRLNERITYLSDLKTKIASYKKPHPVSVEPKVDFSKLDPQIDSPLLHNIDIASLIFSHLNIRELNKLKQLKSKKAYIAAKRVVDDRVQTPIQFLSKALNNPDNFKPALADKLEDLSTSDRQWIQSNSQKILPLLSHPDLSQNPRRFEFFKMVAANLSTNDLKNLSASDENFNAFVLSLLITREIIRGYAAGDRSLKDVLSLNWDQLAPYLKAFPFLTGGEQYNFITKVKSEIESVDKKYNEEFWLFLVRAQINDSATTDMNQMIDLIPQSVWTVEFAKKLIAIRPNLWWNLPSDLQNDHEIRLLMIKIESSSFRELSEDIRNNKPFVLEALKANGNIFSLLAKPLQKDEDIIKAAILHNGLKFSLAPYKMQTKEFAYELVKQNGKVFETIPHYFRKDRDLLLLAMKTYPDAVAISPYDHEINPLSLDKELLQLAIDRSRSISPRLADTIMKTKDKKLLIDAIYKGMDPKELIYLDIEVTKAYILNNIHKISAFEKQFGTDPEIWEFILVNFPNEASYLPTQLRNPEFIQKLIARKPEILKYLFVEQQTPENWKIAIQNGLSIREARPVIRNNEVVVLEAVKYNGLELAYASSSMKNNRNIVAKAIEQNWEALQYASDELKNDPEMVALAATQNMEAIKYASGTLKNNEAFKKFLTNIIAAKNQAEVVSTSA